MPLVGMSCDLRWHLGIGELHLFFFYYAMLAMLTFPGIMLQKALYYACAVRSLLG